MAHNSLFAVSLRSPWWISLAIAVVPGGVAMALLPPAYCGVGALSGFPFLVIAAMAAWRGRDTPSADLVERSGKALASMSWPAFASALEAAFNLSEPAATLSALERMAVWRSPELAQKLRGLLPLP